MSYRIHKGRTQWGFWHQTWPQGRYGPVEVIRGWVDVGPAPVFSRGQRAVACMARLERLGQTARLFYRRARRIAYLELFGAVILE